MTYEELQEMFKTLGIEDDKGFSNAMDETYTGITNGANARIAELETANADLSKQLQETQAKNYVLMTAATAKVVSEPSGGSESEQPTDEDMDVSSLFE